MYTNQLCESDVVVRQQRPARRAHERRQTLAPARAIQSHGEAAEHLGLRPSTLRNRMRKLGIHRPAEA